MLEKRCLRGGIVSASVVLIGLSACADGVACTSASYVQNGLIAQWDGIDNVGTGAHDPTATTWKDLKGDNDLTIVGGLRAEGRNAEWRRGICLYFNNIALGKAAVCGSKAATSYKTIEIVYKMTSRYARILFWGGDRSRYVLFDSLQHSHPFSMVYFDGSEKTMTYSTPFTKVMSYNPTSAVATYNDNNSVTDVFIDGAAKMYYRAYNTWGAGDNRVTLGWRSVDTQGANYGWAGEVYTIRLYDRVLTAEEIARNNAIDVKRFFTSAMYDPTGMVSFWDAKDNAGVGQHDSSATTWKNLVPGKQDLTLDGDPNLARWTDSALLCNNGITTGPGIMRSAAYGSTTLEYSTLETLFRNERMGVNSFLFSNGIDRYCVLATGRVQWQDNVGILTFDHTCGGNHSLSWARIESANLLNAWAYIDGERTAYGNYSDTWGAGGSFVQVGGRSTGGQNFSGRIYAVRAYSSQLDRDKVYENRKIDDVRYANSMWWNGGDGSFGTVGNWREVDAASAPPGNENTVELPYGTYTITLDQDRTVGAMRARNGNLYYYPSRVIDATVDMGGHKLTLVGSYKAEGRSGYNGRRFARLNLTNGTFQAESVRIGMLSDRIVDNYDTWTDYADAFRLGSGSFCVEGPGTTATVRKTVGMEGPCTTFRVAGGATFSCDDLRVYSTKERDDAYPAGKYDRALVEFSGVGTTATLGKFSGYNDVDVVVSNGAAVAINASVEYFSSVGCWICSVGRSFETLPGAGSVVVDDASLTLKCDGFAVGASYMAPGSGGSTMTLRNNAALTLAGTARFFVGLAKNESQISAAKCVLNVLSGATFGGGSTKLEVGPTGNTSFSGINVDDATVNCKALYLGSCSSDAGTCSSNDFLNVAGSAPRISISDTGADSLKLRTGARLRFTIPEGGFAATPIVTAGGVRVEPDEDSYAVDPVKLVVDASAFKGGSQTLVETVTDSTASFQRLVANMEGKGEVAIMNGGRKLVYFRPGSMIILY